MVTVASQDPAVRADASPVAGRRGAPAFIFRIFDKIRRPKNPLDLHLIRLAILHPEAAKILRRRRLRWLSQATKKALLAQINEALGIKDIRTNCPGSALD
jgi:hypothetical protein